MAKEEEQGHRYSACGHIDALLTPLEIPNDKKGRKIQFIDVGTILNIPEGKTRVAPVLRALSETKSGTLGVLRNQWIEVKFCPLCGENAISQNDGS